MKLYHILESGLRAELREIEARLNHYRNLLSESEQTDQMFDSMTKMLLAAKRGLGIAERLRDPKERAKHRRNILGTMARLRAQMDRIEDEMRHEMPQRHAGAWMHDPTDPEFGN